MKNFIMFKRYIIFLLNFIRYKPFLKKSNLFFICNRSTIIGCKMISLGNHFFANSLLRIEVFGNGKTLKLIIGENVGIGRNVHIGVNNKVEIGDNVLIGSNVLITDHNHGVYSGVNQSSPFEPPSRRVISENGSIKVESNVWIGDGVVILPNTLIGSGSIIGANTVVTKNIPSNVIVGGNPAKVLKSYDISMKQWL